MVISVRVYSQTIRLYVMYGWYILPSVCFWLWASWGTRSWQVEAVQYLRNQMHKKQG